MSVSTRLKDSWSGAGSRCRQPGCQEIFGWCRGQSSLRRRVHKRTCKNASDPGAQKRFASAPNSHATAKTIRSHSKSNGRERDRLKLLLHREFQAVHIAVLKLLLYFLLRCINVPIPEWPPEVRPDRTNDLLRRQEEAVCDGKLARIDPDVVRSASLFDRDRFPRVRELASGAR